MVNSPLLNPLHEYANTLSLKFPQLCCARRYCSGKDSQGSPYFLHVATNPSFLQTLAWVSLLAQYPLRGEPSFQVTEEMPQ